MFKDAFRFKKLKNEKMGKNSDNVQTLAANYLIQRDQEQSFPREIESTKENDRETLARLVLVWDKENKLLRIDGRCSGLT